MSKLKSVETNNIVTPEIVSALKAQYPGKSFFKKNLFGQDYITTTLTRAQYRQITEWAAKNPNVKPSQFDDEFIKHGLVWPEIGPVEEMTLIAGVYPTLSQLIQEKSLLTPANGDFASLYTAEVLVEREDAVAFTPEEIERVKSDSPFPLHLVTILGQGYVVRPLLRAEWTSLNNSNQENQDTDVKICERCVRLPGKLKWEEKDAGVPSALARHILLYSGFQNEGEAEEL